MFNKKSYYVQQICSKIYGMNKISYLVGSCSKKNWQSCWRLWRYSNLQKQKLVEGQGPNVVKMKDLALQILCKGMEINVSYACQEKPKTRASSSCCFKPLTILSLLLICGWSGCPVFHSSSATRISSAGPIEQVWPRGPIAPPIKSPGRERCRLSSCTSNELPFITSKFRVPARLELELRFAAVLLLQNVSARRIYLFITNK